MPLQTAERRRSQQRADVRRTILEAAESILMEAGSAGFSIRRLAERCGYTAPTIYHHFGDKQGLVDEVLERRFAELVTLMGQVPARPDPVDTIRDQARAFVEFGLRNPDHYRLLTAAREPGAEPPASAEAARAAFAEPWRALESAGRLQVEGIEAAQNALWALVHGMILLHSQRPDLDWPPGSSEQSIEALVRGLVAPDPTRRRPRRNPDGERG